MHNVASDLARTVTANMDVFALAFFLAGILSALLVQVLRVLMHRRLMSGQEPASSSDFFAVMPSQYFRLTALVFGAKTYMASRILTRIVIILTRISIAALVVIGVVILAATAFAPK